MEKKTQSCSKSCGPSDMYKGGKCDKNGCYEETTKPSIEEAKQFLASKGIHSLDTKKRTLEVYQWLAEFAQHWQEQQKQPTPQLPTDEDVLTGIEEYMTEKKEGMYEDDGTYYIFEDKDLINFLKFKAGVEPTPKEALNEK